MKRSNKHKLLFVMAFIPLVISQMASAVEVATPAIPTWNLGALITDPPGRAASYICSVTNLTNKAQTVTIEFLNEKGKIIPVSEDPYQFYCMADVPVTIDPQKTYTRLCPVTTSANVTDGLFVQFAARCRVTELTGNADNWKVSLCALGVNDDDINHTGSQICVQ